MRKEEKETEVKVPKEIELELRKYIHAFRDTSEGIKMQEEGKI